MASRDGGGVCTLVQMAAVVYKVGAGFKPAPTSAGPLSRGARHGGWGRSSRTPSGRQRRRTRLPPGSARRDSRYSATLGGLTERRRRRRRLSHQGGGPQG